MLTIKPIQAGGLYWKNDWSVETKRTFLSWQAFAEREVELDTYHIKLSRGDSSARKQMVKLLQEIKTLLL